MANSPMVWKYIIQKNGTTNRHNHYKSRDAVSLHVQVIGGHKVFLFCPCDCMIAKLHFYWHVASVQCLLLRLHVQLIDSKRCAERDADTFYHLWCRDCGYTDDKWWHQNNADTLHHRRFYAWQSDQQRQEDHDADWQRKAQQKADPYCFFCIKEKGRWWNDRVQPIFHKKNLQWKIKL